jgi:hypothetical protein
MTFLVGKDGEVYQKDLGENSADEALAMTKVSPVEGWIPTAPHTGMAARSQ